MLLNLLFLFACGDDPKDTDEPTVVDADNDGYGEDWDCDDNDANVFPSNTEICDGIDNNCDGYIDEDLTVIYYADEDGDGFGDETSYQESCEAVDGFVENSEDCDDGNVDINPDADELCDDVDHNCDESATDEATDAPTWYYDADMDGYGSDADAKMECDMPEGYVDNMTDCDDTNASSYPEAPEICDNADNDCDTEIDEDPTDPTSYYQDLDGDGYGDDAVMESSCIMPEGFVDIGGDCDDNNVNAYDSTATETCDGFDNNCDGNADEGVTTTYYADTDGDTYGDPNSTEDACEAPMGYITDGTDCLDSDSDVYPGNLTGETDPAGCYIDADGDGFGDDNPSDSNINAGTDCDDASQTNNTNGTEVCDGADNNCDGTVDEGVTTTYYADTDGDTYGDPDATMEACAVPEGYVEDMTDCDDSNEFAYDTSTEEICDDADNNCDGTVDEGVTTTYYADTDGDTYGDPDATMEACAVPEGYVEDMTDCDDDDINANPGAAEIPGDSIDNDCINGDASGNDVDGDNVDASIDCDDNDDSVGAATVIYYADTDSDTYGDPDVPQTFCSEEDATTASFVSDMTDCDDSNRLANDPTAEEICDGADNNCDGSGDDGVHLIDEGVAGDVYTDADGDGFGDESTAQSLCFANMAADQVQQGGDCNDVSEDENADSIADGFPINPDATEIPADGIDQDCTGTETCYEDTDLDGYGSTTTTESVDLSCSASGVSEVSTDCDDDNMLAYDTNATEVCDGADNNCNTDIDEGTESEQVMMYMDTDGDCYGDNASGQMMCPVATTAVVCDPDSPGTVPEYTADNTDCNDTDATVNPNATENANEGDKNCDGFETGDLSVTDLQVGDLQIMEIMINPAAVSDSNGEWFEVYVSDTLSGTLQLNGLVLSNISAGTEETEVLSANLMVSGGDYITFAANADSLANGGLSPDATFGFGLNQAGEIVGLWSEEGAPTAIDSVDVDGSGSTSEGVALAKDEQDAWCAAIEAYGEGDLGTPGASNYSCQEYAADCEDGVDNDGDGDTDCDDSDCSAESVCQQTASYSFSSDVAPLLNGYCEGCHGGSADTYSWVQSRVVAGNASGSTMYQKISGTQSSGSRMPLGGSPMSADEIAIIGDWIDQGASNN